MYQFIMLCHFYEMSELSVTDSRSLKSTLDNTFNIGGNTTLDDHNT